MPGLRVVRARPPSRRRPGRRNGQSRRRCARRRHRCAAHRASVCELFPSRDRAWGLRGLSWRAILSCGPDPRRARGEAMDEGRAAYGGDEALARLLAASACRPTIRRGCATSSPVCSRAPPVTPCLEGAGRARSRAPDLKQQLLALAAALRAAAPAERFPPGLPRSGSRRCAPSARHGVRRFSRAARRRTSGRICSGARRATAWLTGFTGSAGLAAVLPEGAAMFVDGRYTLQARTEVDPEPLRPFATSPSSRRANGSPAS